MIVSATERRNVLQLFNISEAARKLGVDVFRLHRDIREGSVMAPKIRLGRRPYFGPDDLEMLRTHYTEGKGERSCH